MLKLQFLGQFKAGLDTNPVEIPSRPAQSLLAYLMLHAGSAERREKLAGLLWPESTEANARSNLRHALWRLRKALETHPEKDQTFFVADDFTIAFDPTADYWLDVETLDEKQGENATADELLDAVSVYRGELLPGFYDEWIVLERERLQMAYERKMQLLLERLVAAARWPEVLEWGEEWIALGLTPEPAYRALMMAHGARGDLSGMAAVYQRCVAALHHELGVEPSEPTRDLFEKLSNGEIPFALPDPIFEIPDQDPTPGEPPYKGLRYYDQGDAGLFFGRERLTAELVARLDPDKGERFLAVIGPSGSGKSSVVRAGLIPALQDGAPLADGSLPPAGSTEWPVHIVTPTAHPLEALASSLTRDAESVTATTTLIDDLASDPRSLHLYVRRLLPQPSSHLLLVVDQFEELFTLCRSEAERHAFVANLMTAVETDGSLVLVIALRADFVAHCSQLAPMCGTLQDHLVPVGPMSSEELQRAVTEPARQEGWQLEPGLLDLLLREVGQEPGALPLLSHALLETWRRRRGHTLTLRGYGESGGVRGAVAQTAERVYRGMEPEQRAIARSVFLRLTELGEGTLDTRRRAKLSELVPCSEDEASVEAVLQTLADARLITINRDTAEVAHEVLIREWPTLQGWLGEDRAALRLHRHLTESAQAWEKLECDAGELYRGARLAQAGEWAEQHAGEMNSSESQFLEASRDLVWHRHAEREAQQQREVEAAQQLAATEKVRAEQEARAGRRLRWLAAGLGLLLLVALASTAFAIGQSNLAEQKAREAAARELSAAAISNLDIDPELSVLLALQAVTDTRAPDGAVLPEAEDALHQAVQALRVQFTVLGTGGVGFGPGGDRIATTDLDGTAKIRDAVTGQELLTLSGHAGDVQNLTWSPDGTRLATTSLDGTAKLWDSATGQELLTLVGHSGGVMRPAFSGDGSLLATTSRDGTAKLWDGATGEELLTLSHTALTAGPDLSPDGTLLAVADGAAARVWDLSSGELRLTLTGHMDTINGVVFSPDGAKLATAASDGVAKLWDAATGNELLTFHGHGGFVYGLDFSTDGSSVATASTDGTAKVWDATTGRELLTLVGHSALVSDVAFGPDGDRLLTGSADGTARVWDISPQGSREWLTLAGHRAAVSGIAYDPEGMRLASSSWDGSAKVWDAASGQELLALAGHAGRLASIAFSPDGERLATGGYEGTARIWDAQSGQELLVLDGHTDAVLSVAFSPDGGRLASAGLDGVARVWDAASGEELYALASDSAGLWHIAFSPDGKHLATASEAGSASLWDAASGQRTHTLRGHTDRVVGVAFSPDGTLLSTASFDATAKVWDVASGGELITVQDHNAALWNAAFSPDGERLATSSFDGIAKVWDLAALLDRGGPGSPIAEPGRALLTLRRHNDGPDLAFSPDGKYLATTSVEGTIRVYVLPEEELAALAQSRLTRSLTDAECRQYLHLTACPESP